MANSIHFRSTPIQEGVRLEIGRKTVFAVRNEERDIVIRMRREPRRTTIALMHIPFLRGIVRMFLSVYQFLDGLSESAELNPQRIIRTTAAERSIARFLHVNPYSLALLVSAVLMPLILAVGMFITPAGAELILQNLFHGTRAATNCIVAAVRILGTLGALWLVAHLRGFNRILMYRCAINKVTNCCECGDDVTIENCARYPRYARVSNGAFLIIVLIASLLFFPLVYTQNILTDLLARIGIILACAAVINEPVTLMEEAEVSKFIRVLRAPYDFLQHMTTIEPHIQVLEVAVCAFRAGLDLPEKEEEEN